MSAPNGRVKLLRRIMGVRLTTRFQLHSLMDIMESKSLELRSLSETVDLQAQEIERLKIELQKATVQAEMARPLADLEFRYAVAPELEEERYADLLAALVSERGMPCTWCSSSNTGMIQKAVSAYGGTTFDVWHCFSCGSRFSPIHDGVSVNYDLLAGRHAWYKLMDCDADMVESILAQGIGTFWSYMAAQYINNIPWNLDRRYREFMFTITEQSSRGNRLSIIEVGCGRGMAGGVAAHLGHSYIGVDVQSTSLQKARAQFSRFGASYETVDEAWFADLRASATYDLVYSSEVIEHVSAPGQFLRKLLSLAKPGGRVIFTTPSLDAVRTRVWASDLPPVHTVFLSHAAIEETIAELAPEANLQLYREDFGPDFMQVYSAVSQAPSPFEFAIERGGAQLNPADPSFFYDEDNVGFSPTLPDRRYNSNDWHETSERSAYALLHGVRKHGSSAIVVLDLP